LVTFLADAVFVFLGFEASAAAVVVPVVVEAAGVVDPVPDPFAAHGRTSDAPVFSAFAFFAASFFRIARDLHLAFVALPASFVPAATQMQALFEPQALSSRLRHGEAAFAVLGLAAGVAEPSAGAEDAAAASGAGLAAPSAGAAAAAFFCFVLCLTGAAAGAPELSVE
jgi:hypothetical protein